MPQVTIQAGAKLFVPNGDEIRGYLKEALIQDERERSAARAFKWMRLPEVLRGAASGSAITLGATKGQSVGPASGYTWALRRLVVGGLTSGTTPDVINLYVNDRFSGPPLWQFNGNNFGYTFGKLELLVMGGETLSLQSVGTFASTSLVTLSGELTEVPSEMVYKLD